MEKTMNQLLGEQQIVFDPTTYLEQGQIPFYCMGCGHGFGMTPDEGKEIVAVSDINLPLNKGQFIATNNCGCQGEKKTPFFQIAIFPEVSK